MRNVTPVALATAVLVSPLLALAQGEVAAPGAGASGVQPAALPPAIAQPGADARQEARGVSRKSEDLKLQALGDGYGQLQAGKSGTDTGTLGFGIGAEGKHVSVSVFYKKSSDNDVRNERVQFGGFLLSPSSAGSSFSGDARVYFHEIGDDDFGKLGVRGFFEAGSTEWVIGDVTKSAGALASGIGPAVQLTLSRDDSKNKVVVAGYAGFTSRYVRGDAGRSNEFLDAAIGAIHKEYYGYDAGVTLSVNQVYGSLTYVRLYGGDIDGLTGGQILLAIGVRGGVDLL